VVGVEEKMLKSSHIEFINTQVDRIISNYFGTNLFNDYNNGIEKCKGLIVLSFSNDIWDGFTLEEMEELENYIEVKLNAFYNMLCALLDNQLEPFELNNVFNF
jgi:hypothetical protein